MISLSVLPAIEKFGEYRRCPVPFSVFIILIISDDGEIHQTRRVTNEIKMKISKIKIVEINFP